MKMPTTTTPTTTTTTTSAAAAAGLQLLAEPPSPTNSDRHHHHRAPEAAPAASAAMDPSDGAIANPGGGNGNSAAAATPHGAAPATASAPAPVPAPASGGSTTTTTTTVSRKHKRRNFTRVQDLALLRAVRLHGPHHVPHGHTARAWTAVCDELCRAFPGVQFSARACHDRVVILSTRYERGEPLQLKGGAGAPPWTPEEDQEMLAILDAVVASRHARSYRRGPRLSISSAASSPAAGSPAPSLTTTPVRHFAPGRAQHSQLYDDHRPSDRIEGDEDATEAEEEEEEEEVEGPARAMDSTEAAQRGDATEEVEDTTYERDRPMAPRDEGSSGEDPATTNPPLPRPDHHHHEQSSDASAGNGPVAPVGTTARRRIGMRAYGPNEGGAQATTRSSHERRTGASYPLATRKRTRMTAGLSDEPTDVELPQLLRAELRAMRALREQLERERAEFRTDLQQRQQETERRHREWLQDREDRRQEAREAHEQMMEMLGVLKATLDAINNRTRPEDPKDMSERASE